MTAPLPRETADHAELARLAEARQSWSLGIYKNREQADDAARFNALDLPATVLALPSEIAVLRGRENELIATHAVAVMRIERQRDEAVGLLRDTVQSSGLYDTAGASIAEKLNAIHAFLATKEPTNDAG